MDREARWEHEKERREDDEHDENNNAHGTVAQLIIDSFVTTRPGTPTSGLLAVTCPRRSSFSLRCRELSYCKQARLPLGCLRATLSLPLPDLSVAGRSLYLPGWF